MQHQSHFFKPTQYECEEINMYFSDEKFEVYKFIEFLKNTSEIKDLVITSPQCLDDSCCTQYHTFKFKIGA